MHRSSVDSATGKRDRFHSGKLAQNTVINLFGQIVPLVVAVIAIPKLIGHLGSDRFGILTLAWTLVGYFTLFDLGLGRALTKSVSEKLGQINSEKDLAFLFWTTLIATFGLGSLASVMVFLLSEYFLSSVIKVPAEFQQEAVESFKIIAFALPFVISAAALKGFLEAFQKFGRINMVQIPMGIFSYLGPLVLTAWQAGLPSMISILLVGRVAAWIAFYHACLQSCLSLRSQFGVRKNIISDLLRYGGWITVSNVVGPIISYVDRFFIGAILGVAAVAYYTTPFEMIIKVWLFPSALMAVVFPAFASKIKAEPKEVAILFIKSLKSIAVMVFPVSLIVIGWSNEILSLWISPAFADQSAVILQILAASILINSVGFVPAAFLQAIGRPDLPSKLYTIELPLYVLSLVVLIRWLGAPGAAVAWFLRASVDTFLLLYFSKIQLPQIYFSRLKILMALLFTSISFLGAYWLEDPWQKMGATALVLISYFLIIWNILITHGEREVLKRLLTFRDTR